MTNTNQNVANVANTVVEPTNVVKNEPGRPVNPNSNRQKRLAEMAERAKANGGTIKLGRPADPNSKRQAKLAEMAERAAANGGTIKLGRPVDPNSPRQLKLKEIAERRAAAGGQLQKGRPKGTGKKQTEGTVNETPVTEAPVVDETVNAVLAETVEPITEEVVIETTGKKKNNRKK